MVLRPTLGQERRVVLEVIRVNPARCRVMRILGEVIWTAELFLPSTTVLCLKAPSQGIPTQTWLQDRFSSICRCRDLSLSCSILFRVSKALHLSYQKLSMFPTRRGTLSSTA